MTGDLTFFKANAVKYYGVFCDEFDKENPYSDILTNVRKSYFETQTRQKDKLTKRVDGEQYRYQFVLDEDHPLKWKVFTNTHILEKTVVNSDETYFVEIKDKYNKLVKRIFFGLYHNWIRTQYFVAGKDDPAVQLLAFEYRNLSVILKYKDGEQKPEILFPCSAVKDKATLERITEKTGVPEVSAFSSMGYVYFAPQDISRKWNELASEESERDAYAAEMPTKQLDKKRVSNIKEQTYDIKTASARPRIDLSQTQDVIIPDENKQNNVAVPSVLHTPNVENIGVRKNKPSDPVNSDKSVHSQTVRSRPFGLHSNEIHSYSADIDTTETNERVAVEHTKLHSDMLLNYTGEIKENKKNKSISALDFVGLGDSDSDDDLDSANENTENTEITDICSDNPVEEEKEPLDNNIPSILADNIEATQVFNKITQEERKANIAERAKRNTIEEVKRAYSMKKVQAVTDAPKRTVPVDKIIRISDEEQYYYFGELKDNKRNGRGRTIMKNGNTAYDGGYCDDKRDGFGVYYYKTGRICYVGDWKDNRRNGVGVAYQASDRSMLVGAWEDNCPVGMGARFDSNGNLVFAGCWEYGTKEGAGMTYNPKDGSIFVSRWEDDVLSDKGTKFDSNGNLVYNGYWKKGKRNGYGTQYNKKGLILYTGEWKDDKYNGTGTMYLSNGFKIEGDFVDGKVSGFATVITKKGSKLYEGSWEDNRYNGEGKLYMSDGSWCQGEFSKGEPVGVLSGYSKDGALLYKGEWRDGKFHGKGICYDNGEKIYEGDLDNGIRSGSGHEYVDGKCIYVGSFENNERKGFGTSYDEHGSIVYSGQWTKGMYDGFGLLYSDGNPRFAGQFVMGKLNGRVNEIKDGIVVKECIYSEGECVYMREYTDDGLTLKYDGNVKKGLYEGMGCGFSPYGEKYFEGIFKKNEPFKNMKVSLRKLSKLEYCDDIAQSQYNKFIKGPNYVVEQPYNGGAYSGLLVNDKPEGKGTILYSDHGYTGAFSDGAACGLGVIYEWDGSEITGTFVNSSNEATTEITLANGITYHLLDSH